MGNEYVGNPYAMGPRVPAVRARDSLDMATSTLDFRVPSRVIVPRAAQTTEDCSDPRMCEKPVGSSGMTIAIVLGVCLPLIAISSVLFYLHRRNKKKQMLEDMEDPHKSLDFGLEQKGAAQSSRKSLISREKDGGQQSRYQRQQMSMDMNLTSPYLLPPEVNSSRDSLHSLARTLHGNEDPYRPVAQYAASETGSIRSFRTGNKPGSIYTRSESRADGPRSPGIHSPPPFHRQDSYTKSPLASPSPPHMKSDRALSDHSMSPPGSPPRGPLPPIGTAISTMPLGPRDENGPIGVALQEPPPIAQRSAARPTPAPLQPSPADSGMAVEYGEVSNPFEKPLAQEVDTPTDEKPSGLGLAANERTESTQQDSARASMSEYGSRPSSPPQQKDQTAAASKPPVIAEPEPLKYDDMEFAEMPELPREPRSPSPSNANRNTNANLDVEEEPRGRNMQRMSHLYEQQQQQNAARQSQLGVPQQDNRRLSVGYRPLPPEEILDSEDPEYRANRIRSFYKEYFDETKPEDRPPVPQLPPQHQQQQQQSQGQGHQGYYEDYDPQYMQDAPYFDPNTNSFVMPYAQPVSRRAMTPPPSGQRFPGPRGPPRGFNGPQPSPSFPPNMRGPPRPGSSVSNQMGGSAYGSRPGSAMSGPYGRPRAGSAMSGSRAGSRAGGPRKPMPPPADLTTLPTPSKLKDDSLAILNPIDFAPPESFASRARGRSQSPLGERRPYKPPTAVHSPLVNSFEELPALPSPHLLRKSGTFTALDFAPPRKFVDSDARSDAGSIRSNKSGLSALHANAIRQGAGRVSKLPGDQVFTQAAMAQTLKPQWGMRD
ncbi:hypothetical protein VTJ49DRAFT_2793 [Mycothermus thermophilus]|uniref:Uncharacterized protein n=1 Tax=Humicola insolens TaxID=85995 RepID=A0ABR3V971_HUMIN